MHNMHTISVIYLCTAIWLITFTIIMHLFFQLSINTSNDYYITYTDGKLINLIVKHAQYDGV